MILPTDPHTGEFLTLNDESLEDKLNCCDGTGWTGNQYERCPIHYEPLDSIWFL